MPTRPRAGRVSQYAASALFAAVVTLTALLLGAGLGIWPVFVLALAGMCAFVVLVLTAPEYALVVSVLLYSSEGWLKAMLSYYGVPVAFSGKAVGAGLLDLCLLLAVVGLARNARRELLRERWKAIPRWTRVGLLLLAAWVGASIVQAASIGSIEQGLKGLRLVQSYAVLALGGAFLITRIPRSGFTRLLLYGFFGVSAYACARALLGPSGVERGFNVNEAGIETYNGIVRASGSLSAAVGLASFLTPAAVFSFAIALTSARFRMLATATLAISSVAVIASFVRSAIVAVVVGFLLTPVYALGDGPSRRRIAGVAGATALAITGLVGGTAVAGHLSADLEQRAAGLVNPLGDKSVRLRFETWRETLRAVAHHPLGTGIGSVGAASEGGAGVGNVATTGTARTTIADNSYLKILREQGWVVAPLFLAGVAILLASIGTAFWWSPDVTPLALGSWAAACAFFVLAAASEYIEQPGKTLAWLLLGLALAEIADRRRSRPEPEDRDRARRQPFVSPHRPRVLTFLGLAAVAIAIATALTTLRQHHFVTVLAASDRGPDTVEQLQTKARSVVENRSTAYGIVQQADALVAPERLRERVRFEPHDTDLAIFVAGATPAESRRVSDAIADALQRAVPHISVQRTESPRLSRLADRIIDRLPGRYPAALGALWTVLVGGTSIVLIWLALSAGRSTRQAATRVSDSTMSRTA